MPVQHQGMFPHTHGRAASVQRSACGVSCVTPMGQAGKMVSFAEVWPGTITQIFGLLIGVHVPACALCMWLWASIPNKSSADSLREKVQEMPPQHVN